MLKTYGLAGLKGLDRALHIAQAQAQAQAQAWKLHKLRGKTFTFKEMDQKQRTKI